MKRFIALLLAAFMGGIMMIDNTDVKVEIQVVEDVVFDTKFDYNDFSTVRADKNPRGYSEDVGLPEDIGL